MNSFPVKIFFLSEKTLMNNVKKWLQTEAYNQFTVFNHNYLLTESNSSHSQEVLLKGNFKQKKKFPQFLWQN